MLSKSYPVSYKRFPLQFEQEIFLLSHSNCPLTVADFNLCKSLSFKFNPNKSFTAAIIVLFPAPFKPHIAVMPFERISPVNYLAH